MTTLSQMPDAEVAHPATAVSDAPFFIVGCGRSGTTLLRVILLGHSRLHISPETHFIRNIVDHVPLSEPLSPQQTMAAVDRIVAHPRWAVMDFPTEEFRRAAMKLNSPRLAEVLNLIYQRHASEAGKTRPGDKTPDYIRYVPQILAIYPEARFIHLIRDGHDVAISYAEVGWGHAYQGSRFEWTQAVRAGESYRDAVFADRVLEVRYEEMVRDLEVLCAGSARFLARRSNRRCWIGTAASICCSRARRRVCIRSCTSRCCRMRLPHGGANFRRSNAS